MIIRRLHIDNFGCFHDFDLELETGVNHLEWHNEAGKSTLLEFIRRIFWGFPDKRSKLNPYPALKGSGLYGGFLEVTLKDGTPLRLERHGARGKLKVISENGDTEELPDIGKYTEISELFYRNVYAVTLDELTAFSALEDPEIRNRLYGNALSGSGVSLSDIHSRLRAESEAIFKKRGTLHLLKRLSAEFEASEQRLAEAAGAMPAYEKAILSAEKLDGEAEMLKGEIEQLQIRILSAEKLLHGEKLRRKLAEDAALFAARPLPPPMPDVLPPFEEQPPTPPAEPENITLPPLPEKPSPAALEGKCDALRAASAGGAEIEKCRELLAEEREIRTILHRSLACTVVTCILGLSAALLLAAFYPKDWAYIIWALAVLSVLPYSLVKGYKALGKGKKVQKKKEDLFFRYALNPVLEDRELPVVLQELMLFQEKMNEYRNSAEVREAQKSRLDQSFLEYKTLRKLHDEKCRAFEERRSAYEKKRLEYESACRKVTSDLARYEAEKLSLAKRRKELDELYPPAPEEMLSEEETALMKERFRSLKEELEQKIELSGAEKREAALLLKGCDTATELNIREQLRGRMRSAAERHLVLAAASAVLERAVARAERERQPELLRKASAIFEKLTCGKYTRVYNSAAENLLKAATPDSPEGKTVGQLSRGTREQLFLALRMALIDSSAEEGEPLPVAFDDVFVNFDRRRRNAAMAAVEEFAAAKQVIIFECK